MSKDPVREAHEKYIKHVIRKVLGEEKDHLTKEEAKKIFDYIERTPKRAITDEIPTDDYIEYMRIKSRHKYLQNTLRRPTTKALAELILLSKGKSTISEDEINAVSDILKKNMRKTWKSKGVSTYALLSALGGIDDKKGIRYKKGRRKFAIKNPEVIEALVEWYTERGILPEDINEIAILIERNAAEERAKNTENGAAKGEYAKEKAYQYKRRKKHRISQENQAEKHTTPKEALKKYYSTVSGKPLESITDAELYDFLKNSDPEEVAKTAKQFLGGPYSDERKELILKMVINQAIFGQIKVRKGDTKPPRIKKTEKISMKAKTRSRMGSVIHEATRRAGIRRIRTAKDIEDLFYYIEEVIRDIKRRDKGEYATYVNTRRIIINPPDGQIAALAAIVAKDEIGKEDIERAAKELGLDSPRNIPVLTPYEEMGLIKYRREGGKIKILSKKTELLEKLLNLYILRRKIRKAREILEKTPSYYPQLANSRKDYILRAKVAADLVFGKDDPHGFLHVLLNPYDVRTHEKKGRLHITSSANVRQLRRKMLGPLKDNPEFFQRLQEGMTIERIPEGLRYALWVGRVAKIIPVDERRQKVVWASKDNARAWAEFFERHRERLFKKRRE